MKYLVTGGAGFIGLPLSKRLLEHGHEVVVLDNFRNSSPERLKGLGCEVIAGDVREKQRVVAAASGCDSILHLAYIQGTKNFYSEPSEILSVAIEGMQSVLLAAKFNGIRELLLVSSAEAHQSEVIPTPEDTPLCVPDVLNPRFSYGGGKIACELMASAALHDKLLERVIIARPHNVIGPDMCPDHIVPDFIAQMEMLIRDYGPNPVLPFRIKGEGHETRSYTYVDDAVDQFLLLLEHAPSLGTYHIGSFEERTTAEVARAVARCYHREIALVRTPLAPGSPLRRKPDMKFLRSLGYTANTDFPEAISKTVGWYQEHQKAVILSGSCG